MSAKITIIQFPVFHRNPSGFMLYSAENSQAWLKEIVRQFLVAVNMGDVGAITFPTDNI